MLESIGVKLPKADAPAPIFGMSSMIEQGKSLESYAESIGVKLPKTDAPAPTLGMSSMIEQGKSLESYAESIGVKLPKTDAPAPTLGMSSMIEQGKSLESYAESIGVKLPKTDAPAPTLGMSSMIEQGKSLESYAESIGVKLPKTDAPAPTLGMSSMIEQGKSLESYAESIGVKLPKVSNQDSSKFFLVNSIEEFSSNLLEIKPPKLDSTEIILVVTSPFAIYVLLIAEGIVRPPNQPKIPQYASFYFILVCYVFGTFSTPFSIGQSYWGTAYAEMDNSTDNSTNSTDITNPEYISVNLTDEEESAASPIQNATLTETDNVADSDGPKHYAISLSEGLSVGDGSSNESQEINEPAVSQTSSPSANSTNTQLSESISFFDYATRDQQTTVSSATTNTQLSESISFFDYAAHDQQTTNYSDNQYPAFRINFIF